MLPTKGLTTPAPPAAHEGLESCIGWCGVAHCVDTSMHAYAYVLMCSCMCVCTCVRACVPRHLRPQEEARCYLEAHDDGGLPIHGEQHRGRPEVGDGSAAVQLGAGGDGRDEEDDGEDGEEV